MTDEPAPTITEEVFRHLVELAQLELDEDQAEYLLSELNAQLAAIRQLDAIDVDGSVPISSHGVPYESADCMDTRLDEVVPSGLSDAILEIAPETDGRYFVVPDIPHEDLG